MPTRTTRRSADDYGQNRRVFNKGNIQHRATSWSPMHTLPMHITRRLFRGIRKKAYIVLGKVRALCDPSNGCNFSKSSPVVMLAERSCGSYAVRNSWIWPVCTIIGPGVHVLATVCPTSVNTRLVLVIPIRQSPGGSNKVQSTHFLVGSIDG